MNSREPRQGVARISGERLDDPRQRRPTGSGDVDEVGGRGRRQPGLDDPGAGKPDDPAFRGTPPARLDDNDPRSPVTKKPVDGRRRDGGGRAASAIRASSWGRGRAGPLARHGDSTPRAEPVTWTEVRPRPAQIHAVGPGSGNAGSAPSGRRAAELARVGIGLQRTLRARYAALTRVACRSPPAAPARYRTGPPTMWCGSRPRARGRAGDAGAEGGVSKRVPGQRADVVAADHGILLPGRLPVLHAQ